MGIGRGGVGRGAESKAILSCSWSSFNFPWKIIKS